MINILVFARSRYASLVGKFHAKRKITKKSHNEVRSVVVEILTEACKLDDEGNDIYLISARPRHLSWFLINYILFISLTGKIAWTKLLDIFFHIVFECADGRSEQFL